MSLKVGCQDISLLVSTCGLHKILLNLYNTLNSVNADVKKVHENVSK